MQNTTEGKEGEQAKTIQAYEVDAAEMREYIKKNWHLLSGKSIGWIMFLIYRQVIKKRHCFPN